MGERARSWLAVAIVAVAGTIAVVVIATSTTSADRVDALAGRLRCPVCEGESIADSPSQVARDLYALIAQQVAGGLSDQEIEQYFVDIYGERVLLDPSSAGRSGVLWVLVALAGLGIAGGFWTSTRWRSASAVGRRGALEAELTALDDDLERGLIDEPTAAAGRARAAAELDELSEPAAPAAGRSRRRAVAGAGLMALAILAVAWGVTRAVEPRPEGGFVTGGVATAGAVDLSQVTNEELETVVAANPDVIPMRLALARRYFEAGEYSNALPHYLFVLEREPNPEALTFTGWMTYQSGDVETGVRLLERSLDEAPGELLTQWYLANALWYGLADGPGAIELARSVASAPDSPPELVQAAQLLIEEVGP